MWETKGSPQLSADRLGSQQSREESRAEADLRDTFPWRFQGLHLGGAKKGVGEPFTGLGKIISLKLEDVWRDTEEGGVHSSSSEGRPSFSTWYLESEVGLSTFQLPRYIVLVVSDGLVDAEIPLCTPVTWPSRPLVGRGLVCTL